MKKKTLLTSLLTIAMCLALIAGSTYALFTSEDKVDISVSSGKVNVTATVTNLVTYSMGEVTEVEGKFANGGTALFTTSDVKLLKLDRVTPGDKVTFTIELTNASTVDIQYRLTWNITGALSEALEINATDLDWTKWTTAEATTKTIDVTVELPTDFETQGLEDAAISFKVEAVQANAIVEEVATADQLWAALEMGVDYITLTDDITFDDGKSLVIDEGVTVELALNGNTITNPVKNAAALINNGELTISGEGAIVNGVNDATYIDDKGNTVKNASKTIENSGKLVINGGSIGTKDSAGNAVYNRGGEVTINGGTFASRGESAKGAGYAAYAFLNNGGTMVINDATVVDPTHGLFACYDGTLTVNGGNYTLTGEFACYVTYTTNGTITINGGNINVEYTRNNNYMYAYANGTNYFKNNVTANGFVTLLGGTYSGWSTIANYVSSEYYQAYDNGNGTWTIAPAEGVTLVDTAEKLAAAIANGGIVYVAADIDMNNAWASASSKGELTIVGNDHVITNLNKPLLKGNAASSITIKGLTIANSNIGVDYENGLGTGAFISYKDATGSISFEDCHLVDSKVVGNERVGGLIAYTSGASISVVDCSVANCELTAVGGAGGLVGYSQSVTTIERSEVINTKLTATEDRLGTKTPLAGAIIGTVNGNTTLNNLKVSANTVSNNNATPILNDYVGRWVSGSLVIDGANYVANAATLAALLTSDAEVIDLVLTSDITVAISSLGTETPGSGQYKLGGENTTAINIDLGGNKLTLSTTYMSALGAKNPDATLTIKNGTMTSSSTSGTWNIYDIAFNDCDLVLADIVFEKSIAIEAAGKTATLTDVTINESHDYYALWISAKGQTVNIDGLTINSDGRAIKIDEQYVGTPEKVTLNIKDATFNSVNKAAIVVKSAAGAAINVGENVDISNVEADSTNAVWVDEDSAAYADLVVVDGATCIVEP